MMADSSKEMVFCSEETQHPRQRRSEIKKLKSALTPELESYPRNTKTSPAEEEEEGEHGKGTPENETRGLVYGHVSMMGRRRVMEDAVTVAPQGSLADEYSFFAVYDGHGGATVAEVCSERLHKCLEKYIENAKKLPEEDDFDWKTVMEDCFGRIDEEFEESKGKEVGASSAAVAKRMMGTTAVVVLVGSGDVVVANCGNSRAVLCRGGAPVPLSSDHKPERPDEKERVEAAGGSIINQKGWRVQGVLPTSRSIGDHHLKPYISSQPEVTVTKRTESDDFLIIATDGLWDTVSNELACHVVEKSLRGGLGSRQSEGRCASDAAATLVELAIAKGSRDNITVIVVLLQ
ncbi:probable protein phosphatase 2C 8 [Primulina huaijiensis]|uniref:probable protein phosphatase 2C 8 n=1 Tax=Primulina huaijiensis TaxID=1492673 RepID=UPI003CC74431